MNAELSERDLPQQFQRSHIKTIFVSSKKKQFSFCIVFLLILITFWVFLHMKRTMMQTREEFRIEKQLVVKAKQISLEFKEAKFAEKDAILLAKQANFKTRKDIILQKEASLKEKEGSQPNSDTILQQKELFLLEKEAFLNQQEQIRQEKEALILEGEENLRQSEVLDRQKQIVKQLKRTYAKGVTALFNSYSRYELLNQTLRSFFATNTYPLARVIVVEDGPFQQGVSSLMNTYPNITWLMNNEKMGQLKAIDEAYKLAQTQWVFHSLDDWSFIRPNFIQNSLDLLQNHPYAYHSLLKRSQTQNFDGKDGCSFVPSIRATKYYKILLGGYSGVFSYNISENQPQKQAYLDNYYKNMGLKIAEPEQDYAKYIGTSNSKCSQF